MRKSARIRKSARTIVAMDTERHMILVKRSYYAICLRILCSLGWAQFPHHSYFVTFSHSNLINRGIAATGMSPENAA
jgi:hypothetical protein